MKSRAIVAIDGPAGAGKSTVARMLAKRLGYLYIDTGAMYRALTLKALERKIDLEDEGAVTGLAEETEILLVPQDGTEIRVYCDGRDVTSAIREPEVSRQVSRVAKVPGVRARMVELQRRMAERGGIVMDGRDIGSYVLPGADYKFFLTASLEERTRRRWQELRDRGIHTDFEQLKKEMAARDAMDSRRPVAPLIKAPGALEIDTSNLEPEEVVEIILKHMEEGR
ncbi:(d)CMP kinase [Calderihabitans maritimus]|uniref:Cytidylate kinase n=1 Tax=Calderihabitans maritimus TaxID=1246530 RepID=A0A1Z5HV64_9FIRM|nr:(d)CMP kinase [Calderihabitans maritimus]GAW93225.1 cytidylate kinase [Calderihabitans maritimus]